MICPANLGAIRSAGLDGLGWVGWIPGGRSIYPRRELTYCRIAVICKKNQKKKRKLRRIIEHDLPRKKFGCNPYRRFGWTDWDGWDGFPEGGPYIPERIPPHCRSLKIYIIASQPVHTCFLHLKSINWCIEKIRILVSFAGILASRRI